MTAPGVPPHFLDVSNSPVRRPGEVGKVGVNWLPGVTNSGPMAGAAQSAAGGSVTMTVSGPLFTGALAGMIDAMLMEMTATLAFGGLATWKQNLDASLKNPTPYYETQVTAEPRGEEFVIHDRGIIYGPWLEGVGSRNKTTRFKGYSALRRAYQDLVQRAPGMLEPILTRWVERMNG